MSVRAALIVVAIGFVSTATAAPAPPPHAVFDAEVLSIGASAPFLCGGLMATQDVRLSVSKVSSGPARPKTILTVRVLTCFGGHLLRPIGKKEMGLFELDPGKIRPGSILHIDAENYPRDSWFTTVDKITVTKF